MGRVYTRVATGGDGVIARAPRAATGDAQGESRCCACRATGRGYPSTPSKLAPSGARDSRKQTPGGESPPGSPFRIPRTPDPFRRRLTSRPRLRSSKGSWHTSYKCWIRAQSSTPAPGAVASPAGSTPPSSPGAPLRRQECPTARPCTPFTPVRRHRAAECPGPAGGALAGAGRHLGWMTWAR